MTATVSLLKIYNSFVRADANGDGLLSQREAAREAVLLKKENKTYEYEIFGAFAVGGVDEAGLFPDFFNGNGQFGQDYKIGMAEIAYLAAADISEANGNAS